MRYLGYAAAIVAFLGAQFWGVPHYIRGQVDTQLTAQLEEINKLKGKPKAVQDLEKADAVFTQRMNSFESNQKDTTDELSKLRDTIIAYYESRINGG